MNTMNRLLITGATIASALALTPRLSAQTVRSSSTDLNAPAHTDKAAVEPVSKANKASSLIGMEVRNPQNEKLGDIKDLVVDLPSGKVSYAVLGVGGFLGIGDKYVAIPPGAFSVAPEENNLVLNADKAKIQNAPSFAKSSWPEVNSAAWRSESDYWLSGGTAQGTAGATTSGTASEHLDHNRLNSSSSVEPRTGTATGKVGDRYSTANGDQVFHGHITAISPETRTVTVQGPAGTREFKFSERPTLSLKDNRSPQMTDFKVGYPVNVSFHEANGTFIADSLSRTDAPEVR